MINSELRSKYQATIGIECHVQLKTKTKLFAGVGNDAREAPPNTLVSHICFGLPGALPVLNKEALKLASLAAFALNSRPQKFSKFDRKHYFYPDLPMGYQITQFDEPVIIGGHVDIEIDGQTKQIGITRAHLEADAGKSTHPSGRNYSLVDLNRVGTPLLEIVSEPDMHSALEAKIYARELYLLMRYAGVSEANLYYGNLRFDVNVSVSKTAELGTRTETKNLNSFRSVEKTVEYEIDRQIEVLEKGQVIVQETRGFDDAKQKTFSQRSKENADDYRYMPDPDLPPVLLSDDYINKVAAMVPLLPVAWRKELLGLGLERPQIETLLEAEIDQAAIGYLDMLKDSLANPALAKFLANWFVNLEIPLRRGASTTNKLDKHQRLAIYVSIQALLSDNKLSSTSAKALAQELLLMEDPPSDIEGYADKYSFLQVSDEASINEVAAQVIKDNPAAVTDIQNGEMKAVGFLVGQVMKLSQGQANPALAQELIKKTTRYLKSAQVLSFISTHATL